MINVRLSSDDFFIVGETVDITKDGLLKILSAIPKYEMETKIEILNENMVVILARVKVQYGEMERVGEGRGAVARTEIEKRKSTRPEHDMIALAETRAIKRAIEVALGTSIVNSELKRLISEGQIVLPEENRKQLPPSQIQQQQQNQIQTQQQPQTQQNSDFSEKMERLRRKYGHILVKFLSAEEIKDIFSSSNWKEWYEKIEMKLKKKGIDVDMRKYKPVELMEKLKEIKG